MYTGKDTSEWGQSILVSCDIHQLLTGFENKGHIVYMDNFYSNPNLFKKTKRLKIGACGTVRANQVDLPPLMKI